MRMILAIALIASGIASPAMAQQDKAVSKPKRRFARRENVQHWHVRAHSIEVEEIGPRADRHDEIAKK